VGYGTIKVSAGIDNQLAGDRVLNRLGPGVQCLAPGALRHRCTGKSPYYGPNKPVLRWSYFFGYGFTSCPPLVAEDGTIYAINKISLTAHEMHAVNHDSTRKWKVSNIGGDMALGPDGTIYARCDYEAGTGSWPSLCAMNPADGSRRWTVRVGTICHESSILVGPDGTIYIEEEESGNIHALNPSDGSEKWQAPFGGSAFQLALSPDGGTLYASDVFGILHSYHAADGVAGWASDQPCTWPAAGPDGTVYGMDKWTDGKFHLVALDPATGVTKWAVELNGPGSPPAISGKVIYVTTWADLCKLYAVNDDGSVRWTFDIPGSTTRWKKIIPSWMARAGCMFPSIWV
jgi:outer membrane protein assembly factor BamB